MKDESTWRGTWGTLAGILRRRIALVVVSTVAVAAVLVAFEVHRVDTVARQNETIAQLISDQYESFYAENAAQIVDSGPRRTNAELEPSALALRYQIQFGSPNYTGLGYSGTAKLLQRDESLGSTWVTIQVDVTYPEAFGGHGTLETCYAVSIPTGPKAPPVTSIMPDCSSIWPVILDPSATS